MQGTTLFRALNKHLPAGRENKSVSQREFTGNTQETNILRELKLELSSSMELQEVRLLYTLANKHRSSYYYQDGTVKRLTSGS